MNEHSYEIHFNVKENTLLGQLKESYSERVGIPVTSLRFMYDGMRMQDHDTPNALEMEEDDMIECYNGQTEEEYQPNQPF